MTMMKITGGCHCGAIRFEAEIDPERVIACHCSDCQQMSGAPFRAVAFCPGDRFTVTGTPKHYVKTAESGNRRVQGFCGECGTPIYATSEQLPRTMYGIRLGCVDQRAQLPPRTQVWTRSAMPWLHGLESVRSFEMQSG
jgi:hypothetical protein